MSILKIKMIFLITVAAVFVICVSNVQAQTVSENFWLGYFEHQDGGGKEIIQIEIKKTGDKLTAIYKSEVTAIFWEHYAMNVEIEENTAFFYYDRCLPKGEQDYDPTPCNESTFEQGDLLFKLVKTTGKNKKTVIRSYSEKLSLGYSVEKAKKFAYPIGEEN